MCKASYFIENEIFFCPKIFGVGFGLIDLPCMKLHSLSSAGGFKKSINGPSQS